MKRVTIADVAEKAGVSKSTVSHALSGKRSISAATKARIHAAIAELGYQPNPVAQRLAGGQTQTIGLVLPLYAPQLSGLEMKFITTTAQLVSEAAYTFMLVTSPVEDLAGLRRMIAGGVADGYILMQGWADDPRIPLLQEANLPFVMVGGPLESEDVPFVDVDTAVAMELCVAHLAAGGHQQILYCHPELTRTSFHQQTMAAFVAACARHGVVPHQQPVALGVASGATAIETLINNQSPVTGVIVWNSQATWGVVQQAGEMGRRVPQDLAVIGIGHAAMDAHLPVPLTMLDTKPEAIARRAARLLLELLDDKPDLVRQQRVRPELIVRESSVESGR